jgi:hypothetical protein
MTSIRAAIGAFVAFLHNLWVQGPINRPNFVALWPAIQAVLIVMAFALYQFVLGFGWVVPPDILNWHAWLGELLNAGTLAWAILLPIITQRLWPAVMPYLLKLLELVIAPTSTWVRSAYDPRLRVLVLWERAV